MYMTRFKLPCPLQVSEMWSESYAYHMCHRPSYGLKVLWLTSCGHFSSIIPNEPGGNISNAMLCMSSQNFWEDFSGRYKQAIQVWNFDFLWFPHWCLSVAGGTGTPVLRLHPLKANMFRNMPTNFWGKEISTDAAIVLCPIGWWCPIWAYNTVPFHQWIVRLFLTTVISILRSCDLPPNTTSPLVLLSRSIKREWCPRDTICEIESDARDPSGKNWKQDFACAPAHNSGLCPIKSSLWQLRYQSLDRRWPGICCWVWEWVKWGAWQQLLQ
jgi:hypothetical protein